MLVEAVALRPGPGAMPGEAQALIEEARRRARRRRHRGAAAVALLLTAAAVGYAVGGGGASADRPRAGDGRSPAPSLRPTVTARIALTSALDLAAGFGAVWVAQDGSVARVDGAGARVVTTIRTPAVGDDAHIAVGQGSVWVTSGRDGGPVYRIDPHTDRVTATVTVGGSAIGITVGRGWVWVTRVSAGSESGEVLRIDPHRNRVTGPSITVGPGPAQLSFGSGATWVQNTSPTSVMRIDPGTGRVSTIVGTDNTTSGSFVVGAIAAGDGSLWTVRNDVLARWNPATGTLIATVRIARAELVAVARREVWVLSAPSSSSPTLFFPIEHTAALWEVDPRHNRVAGRPLALNGPLALTVSGARVWVVDHSYRSGATTLLALTPARP